jgi:hypothetical protein
LDFGTLRWLAVLRENLERAEAALLDTDSRRHIDGVRTLHGQIQYLREYTESGMKILLEAEKK